MTLHDLEPTDPHGNPEAWELPLSQYETHLRARGLRERSVDTRIRHMRRLARELHDLCPDEVTSDHLVEWAGTKKWKVETRHSYYQSIRDFFRYYQPGNDPAQTLPTIHRQTPAPRPTPERVFERALAQADERTRAILTIAGRAGLRRSEIAQPNVNDLTEDLLGSSLIVRGKGGKTRIIPVNDEVAAIIRTRGATNTEGWVFPSRDGGHTSSPWLAKLASRAPPPGWSLHTPKTPIRHHGLLR